MKNLLGFAACIIVLVACENKRTNDDGSTSVERREAAEKQILLPAAYRLPPKYTLRSSRLCCINGPFISAAIIP